MRKSIRLLPLLLALALLSACTQVGTSLKDASPTAGAAVTSTPSPSAEASVSPGASPSPAPAAVDNTARCRVFRTFLSDNYKALTDAFTGGISGIGFLDLDCDGGIEMVLFDAGASAALGAEFFDIVNGSVECVSANLDSVAKAFGGKHLSAVTVNANRFDDFRLMADNKSGEEFCVVQSGNGAVDFNYTELVRFSCGADDVLTLESLSYDYKDTDDNGAVTNETFRVAGKTASRAEYEAANAAFAKSAADTKYAAPGVFIWDSGANYPTSAAGLQQMAEKAYALREADPPSSAGLG